MIYDIFSWLEDSGLHKQRVKKYYILVEEEISTKKNAFEDM